MWLSLLATAFAIQINPETRMFLDQFNRTTIFHGVNVIVKVPPYEPITDTFDYDMSLSDEDIKYMRKWGFNFVRLGVMWEAVERSPGNFNQTYLHNMNNLATKLGQSGIYTLIDAHQDVFARRLCGEGVPDFYATDLDTSCDYNIVSLAIEKLGFCTPLAKYQFRYDENGDPLIEDCVKHMFASYYASPEAASAFARIYENKDGMRDKFLAFWKSSVAMFKDNEFVLGYDPLNEPLSANMYKDINLLLPGKCDYENLQPLYKKYNESIRPIDDEKVIFFEPVQSDLFPILGGIIFDTGFTETPGGKDYDNRQILNDHTYCCQSSPDMCSKDGEAPLSAKSTCENFHKSRLDVRTKNAERLGVGLFITEFGACANTEACVMEITAATDAIDDHLVSWAYWQYKGYKDFTTTGFDYSEGLFNPDGTPQNLKVAALTRTYVQAYQGVPISISYNSKNGAFTTKYTLSGNVQAPTILYYNKEVHYQNGILISTISQSNQRPVIVQDEDNYISLRYEPDEAEVALLVTPKQAEECFSYDSLYVEISTDYKSSKIIEHFTQYPYTNFYNESTQQLIIKSKSGEIICKASQFGVCRVDSIDLVKSEAFVGVISLQLPALHNHRVTIKDFSQ